MQRADVFVRDFYQSCKCSVDLGGLSYVFQLFVAKAATTAGHAFGLMSVAALLDGLVLPVMMVCEYVCVHLIPWGVYMHALWVGKWNANWFN